MMDAAALLSTLRARDVKAMGRGHAAEVQRSGWSARRRTAGGNRRSQTRNHDVPASGRSAEELAWPRSCRSSPKGGVPQFLQFPAMEVMFSAFFPWHVTYTPNSLSSEFSHLAWTVPNRSNRSRHWHVTKSHRYAAIDRLGLI